MKFELQYTDPKSNARAGLITTDHGQIETPIFMPVGTLGTVKGVQLPELKEDIKPKFDTISINTDRISCISDNFSKLESSIYSKEETVKAINKEYDYRKEYEECKDENYDLLELIEKYCKYDNKYKVLDIFKEISEKYLVERR